MKLSNVLKVFGAAALVAGLTPYRITRDEETGEKKVRALFWEATSTPQEEGGEKDLSVRLGFFSPAAEDSDEPHFFADELTVEYNKEDVEDFASAEADESLAEEDASEEVAAETAAEPDELDEPDETKESAEASGEN